MTKAEKLAATLAIVDDLVIERDPVVEQLQDHIDDPTDPAGVAIYAQAILAALPNGCLHDNCVHCALEATEKVLPEGWELSLNRGRADFYTATTSYPYSLRHYREHVGPARYTPYVMAHGPTAASALGALATELKGRQG